MAVKILITLEGTDAIKSQLADVQKSGEALVSSLQGLGDPEAINTFTKSLSAVAPATEGAKAATEGFAEAIHILHPVLAAAGIEIQNFAGFARLASAGVVGLATALTGVLVVAFANAEEAAASTQAKLSGLFGSKELGSQAFAALKQGAADLDTTVAGLAPAFQAATVAIQRFVQTGSTVKFVALQGVDLPKGIAGNISDTAAAVENLFKIIRAGGATDEEAQKAAAAFFTTLQNGGKLTADALKQMNAGTVRLLAQALGEGAVSAEQFIAQMALAPKTILQVVQGLAQFGPQAEHAFDTSAVKSFKDEFQGLVNDLQNDFKALSGTTFSQFLIDQLKKVRIAIQATADGWKAFQDFLNKPALTGFSELNAQFKQIDDNANAALAAVGKVTQSAATLPNAFKQVGDQLPNTFKQVGTLGDSFKTLPSNAGKAASEIAPAMKPGLDAAVTQAQTAQKSFDAAFAGPPTASKVFGPSGFLPSASEIKSAVDQLIQIIQNAVDQLKKTGDQGGLDFGNSFGQSAQQRIDAAFGDLGQSAQQRIDAAFSALKPDFSGITNAFQQATSTLPQTAQTQWASVQQVFSTPINFSNISSSFESAVQGLVGTAQSIWSQVQAIFSQQLNITPPGFTPGTAGFARGGFVTGPGTATSDSILARLSSGEFVQPAGVVAHYGVEFMEAIRQLRLPRGFGQRFEFGGLVDGLRSALASGPLPRFAEGGAVSSSQPIHLHLDGQSFAVNASEDVASALRKHAVKSRLLSTGRKPSWY